MNLRAVLLPTALQHFPSQLARCSQRISSTNCPVPGPPPLQRQLCSDRPACAAASPRQPPPAAFSIPPPIWTRPRQAAGLTMNSRMRPWAITGGLQQPTTTPSASFFRDSCRLKGASGTRERNRGVSDSSSCVSRSHREKQD